VIITARDKDVSLDLLDYYGYEYFNLGKNRKRILGKLAGLIHFNLRMFKLVWRYKPDLFISHSSMYAAQVAWLTGSTSITLEDTGNLEQVRLYRPFTNIILSPDCLTRSFGKKNLKYKGFHELSYLHPNVFQKDASIKKELGLVEMDKYIILRFVGHQASHDMGRQKLNMEDKRKMVRELQPYARIFISSEEVLPDDLKDFAFPLPAYRMANALANADLYLGDSGTMASEAAVLGVPAIYIDHYGRDYTNYEEKKYGLVFNFIQDRFDVAEAINKAIYLLQKEKVKEEWKEKQEKFLSEHIDVTNLLYHLITRCPLKRSELTARKIKELLPEFHLI